MQRSLMLALASCVALGFMAAAPASAEARAPTAQIVHYSDLNIDRASGARTLLRRINHAARVACGDHMGRTNFGERRAIRQCEREAVEAAVAKIDNTTLTAMFYDRSPEVTIALR